jgi:hypothetical protein
MYLLIIQVKDVLCRRPRCIPAEDSVKKTKQRGALTHFFNSSRAFEQLLGAATYIDARMGGRGGGVGIIGEYHNITT